MINVHHQYPALVASCVLILTSSWLLSMVVKGRLCGITVFLVLLSATLLNLFWAAIDRITGEGINAAAVYHINYGIRGAGYSDYYTLIAISVICAIAFLLLVGFLVFFRKTMVVQSKALLGSGCLIASLSLFLSPAVPDIYRAWSRAFMGRLDFARVYIPPYVLPRKLASPPPNLIYIYAESLERTYFDESIFPGLMKELRKLENEATVFTGVTQVEGTGWTMAGIVASQCGIPLLVPAGEWAGNSMSGMDAFLPGAKSLSDLLKDNGYYLSFMGGADVSFAGKGKFLKTHRFDEILGHDELLPFLESKNYVNDWGVYDDELFNLALKKAEVLADTQQQFALFILTMEPHPPSGFPSRTVAGTKYGDGSDVMLNSVAGADVLIANFIRELRQSPAGRNTVIILASDHLAFKSKATAKMDPTKRRNLFMIFQPTQRTGTQIDSTGSTLDIAATVLPFLGFRAVGLV